MEPPTGRKSLFQPSFVVEVVCDYQGNLILS